MWVFVTSLAICLFVDLYPTGFAISNSARFFAWLFIALFVLSFMFEDLFG